MTSGAIILAGKAIDGPGPDRGVVFQQYSLYPHLSVFDNLAFPLRSPLRREWTVVTVSDTRTSGRTSAASPAGVRPNGGAPRTGSSIGSTTRCGARSRK